MAVVTAEIRFAPKNAAWFTTNASLVLADGEIVYRNTDGKYIIGDGTTPVSGLTFYGGVSTTPAWGSITGTLSNQTDLQNALNAKLDSATAALTYQPIGSYLTSSAIGVTVQGYSANTTLLGNSTTGSGSIVLATSPTFATQITTPVIYGSGSASGTLTLQSTSNATKGELILLDDTIKLAPTATALTSGKLKIRSKTNDYYGGITIYRLAGDAFLALSHNGSEAVIASTYNSTTGYQPLSFYTSDVKTFSLSAIGSAAFTPTTTNTGAITNFTFTPATNTGQTSATNIPNFRVNGSTKTWAAGAITNHIS